MNIRLGALAKGTFTYGLGGLINRFISFLLLPLFTAYLTAEDFGIISILGMISFFLVPVLSLGFGTSIGLCYFEGNDDRRKQATIWTAAAILFTTSLLLIILGVFFSRPISWLAVNSYDYSYPVIISLLSTAFSVVVQPFTLYTQFQQQAAKYATFVVISSLANIGSSILLVVTLHRGLEGMMEGTLIGQLMMFLLFFFYSVRKNRFIFDLEIARELIRLGAPLIPSFLSLFILLQGNRYILRWYSGLDAVGIFTIGNNLGMLMNLFVSGFNNAWTPFFLSYMEKREEAKTLFGRVFTYYIFGFGTLSLMFFIFSKPIILLMTQPAFHEAYKVVGISASAQFLLGIFNLLLPGMYFAKEVKFVSTNQLLAALFSIGINLIFIRFYGMMGAAIALVVSVLFLNFIQYLWNWYRRKQYLEVQYEWRRVLTFFILYLGVSLPMLQERHLSASLEWLLSLFVTFFTLIAFYLLLKKDERQKIFSVFKR